MLPKVLQNPQTQYSDTEQSKLRNKTNYNILHWKMENPMQSFRHSLSLDPRLFMKY